MVVGFLTTEYRSEASFAGGLASYLGRVSHVLVSAGHTVEVFVTGASDEQYEDDGVRVTRVRPYDHWTRRLADRPFLWRYREPARILGQARALEDAVRRRSLLRRFDVVQAPDFMAPGITMAMRGRIPVVTRLSHYAPLWQRAYHLPPTPPLLQQNLSERHQMRASRAVYAPSHFLAATVGAAEGITVEVVRPPFDSATVARFQNLAPGFGLQRGTYALFFGTIGLMKGADRLADALPQVLQECPDMRFVFAGNVRRAAKGERFDDVIRSRFGPRVLVLPALRHPELLPLVAGSRFVVLPSRVENLPNACLEAMSLGRPVIATRGVSFEELIESGVSGELVPQDDLDALRRAIIEYWRLEPSQLAAIGRAGVRQLSAFAPERTLPGLVSLFERVAQQRPNATSLRFPVRLGAFVNDLRGTS